MGDGPSESLCWDGMPAFAGHHSDPRPNLTSGLIRPKPLASVPWLLCLLQTVGFESPQRLSSLSTSTQMISHNSCKNEIRLKTKPAFLKNESVKSKWLPAEKHLEAAEKVLEQATNVSGRKSIDSS